MAENEKPNEEKVPQDNSPKEEKQNRQMEEEEMDLLEFLGQYSIDLSAISDDKKEETKEESTESPKEGFEEPEVAESEETAETFPEEVSEDEAEEITPEAEETVPEAEEVTENGASPETEDFPEETPVENAENEDSPEEDAVAEAEEEEEEEEEEIDEDDDLFGEKSDPNAVRLYASNTFPTEDTANNSSERQIDSLSSSFAGLGSSQKEEPESRRIYRSDEFFEEEQPLPRRNPKKNSKPVADEKSLKKKKTVVLFGIVLLSMLAMLLIGFLAIYIWFGNLYGNTNFEPADTEIRDLEALMAVLSSDLDADVSSYPEEDVMTARSAAVLNYLGRLPVIDYQPIVDELKSNINADISSYGFSLYEAQVIRWAMRLGYSDRLVEIFLEHEESTNPSGEESTNSPKPPVTEPEDTGVPSVTVNGEFAPEPDPITGKEIKDSDIYNILLVGCDTREENLSGRSDSIMIISINKVSKRVILSSIQRDTIVKDPETKGYAKINDFYARYASTTGKRVGKLINAIKYNFNINIDNYAVVDFKAFEQVISVFGTVEVPLYYSEYLRLRELYAGSDAAVDGLGDLYTDKKEGYIIVGLNGPQALDYARMRKNLYNPVSKEYQRSSDSWRTERQRHVIHGLIRRARTMTLGQLQDIAAKVFPYITTDLSLDDLLLKIASYLDFARYSVDTFNLSGVSGAWYPCTTDGNKIYFENEEGYGTGFQGMGIFEPPRKDGYRMIRLAWREKVYK